ncbi:MAG: Molybdenum ABC transporter permease protein ModB, partial [uncultured Blastococcus sp.]
DGAPSRLPPRACGRTAADGGGRPGAAAGPGRAGGRLPRPATAGPARPDAVVVGRRATRRARGGPGAAAVTPVRHARDAPLPVPRRAAGLGARPIQRALARRPPGAGHRAAGPAPGGRRCGALPGPGAEGAHRQLARRGVRHHHPVHDDGRRHRRDLRGDAVPGDQRRGRPARGRHPVRGRRGHPRSRPVDHLPPRDPAPRGAGRGRRRRPLLGAGAGRVRGDHHLRRQLSRDDADDAARGLPRAAERAGGRDRAVARAARRLVGHLAAPARPLARPVGDHAV